MGHRTGSAWGKTRWCPRQYYHISKVRLYIQGACGRARWWQSSCATMNMLYIDTSFLIWASDGRLGEDQVVAELVRHHEHVHLEHLRAHITLTDSRMLNCKPRLLNLSYL